MRKKWLALALAFTILFGSLAGCGGCSDKGDTDAASSESTSSTDTAAEEAAKEAALKLIADELSLSEDEQANLTVERVSLYDDESVVRFTQTYQGVEVYGSSLLAAVGGDGYTAGTYYDLSDAFDDTFSTQVTAMATTPDWMTDVTDGTQTFSYDTSTATPVIYITEDEEAVLAYTVQATVTEGDAGADLEIIISSDGTELYELYEIDNMLSWNDAKVYGEDTNDSFTLSTDGTNYYAYNSEYNFYGINGNDQSLSYKTLAEKITYADEALGRRVLDIDTSLVYSISDRLWNTGSSSVMLKLMKQYYQVANWFDSAFGWHGLNGDGSASALIFTDDIKIAGNYASSLIVVEEEALSAPEILAHEYGHSVFQYFTKYNPKNETAALNEAVCDIFGALYQGDIENDYSWELATETSSSKNIPEEDKTMDDYQYDSFSQVYSIDLWSYVMHPTFEGTIWVKDNLAKQGVFIYERAYTNQSTKNAHNNSYIISHTVYNIWNQVLEQNNAALEGILFRCLRYLSKICSFSEFRDAFVYATSLIQGADAAAYASQLFTDAKIESAGTISRLKTSTPMAVPTLSPSGISALDFLSYSFSDVQNLNWDKCEIEDYSTEDLDVWSYTCIYGDESVVFDFGDEYYICEYDDPDAAYPWQVHVYDNANGTMELSLVFGIYTGMSYDEVVSVIDESETLVQWEVLFDLYETDEGYAIDYVDSEAWIMATLYFSESEEGMILQSFQVGAYE